MSDELHVEAQAGEGVEPPLPLQRVEAAVRYVLRERGVERAEISVTLMGDTEIERMNREFLQHEGPTDVISFPLEGPGGVVVGDVYLGAAQALRQAEQLGVPAAEEVLRLAVHGTLHVLGFDHPQGEEGREESEMYRLQEELLGRFLAGGEAA